MRLIDADELKKDIVENSIFLGGTDAIEVNCAKALIDIAPTVEYPEQITIKCDTEEDKQKLLSAFRNAKLKVLVEAERPQGEWEFFSIGNNQYSRCSVCKDEHTSEYTDLDWWYENFKYCPNCGAYMVKGE